MLQSCLMNDGEFHSRCCASLLPLPLFLLLPPCCLTQLGLLSFFIESFINNVLCHCHPGLLLNSTRLHSHSIQLIQEDHFFSMLNNQNWGNLYNEEVLNVISDAFFIRENLTTGAFLQSVFLFTDNKCVRKVISCS